MAKKPDSQAVEIARRTAHIMSDASAAAKAVAEYDRRTAEGEDVDIFQGPGGLLVGPPVEKLLKALDDADN